ncbi:hypothetical protein [Nannocystis pusilla]|uniref:hypothetical protein n=1 Tax=Nannocystis pusilla TaxID=889268 RepID=UPI003B76718C
MSPALGILTLFSALLTAQTAHGFDLHGPDALAAESSTESLIESWLAEFGHQLRACRDRGEFFARIDEAIIGDELAALIAACPLMPGHRTQPPTRAPRATTSLPG